MVTSLGILGAFTTRDRRRVPPSHTAAFRVAVAPSTVWLCSITVPVRLRTSSETSGALGSAPTQGNHWENCPVATA